MPLVCRSAMRFPRHPRGPLYREDIFQASAPPIAWLANVLRGARCILLWPSVAHALDFWRDLDNEHAAL